MIPVFQIVANRIAGVRPLGPAPLADRDMMWHCQAALSAAWKPSDGPDPHREWIEERERLRSRIERPDSDTANIRFSGARSAGALAPPCPARLADDSCVNCAESPSCPSAPRLRPPDRAPEATLANALKQLEKGPPHGDGRLFTRAVRDRINACFDGSAPRFYREAGISRFTYSKIMSHPNSFRPDRATVLQMARAFQLPLDDAINFLALAGYALSPDRPEDRVWAVCFELGLYHHLDVEALLTRARRPN